MIKDIFFILRMVVITALIIITAQIHIGQQTLEDHFHSWVKDSVLVDYIEEAVDGGIALVKAGYTKADSNMHVILARISRKHDKKDRGIHFSLKRFDDKNDGQDSQSTVHVKSHVPKPE